MYSIDASVYVMTLHDNILVHYRLPLPPGLLLILMEIVRVGTKHAVVYCQPAPVYLPHLYYAW